MNNSNNSNAATIFDDKVYSINAIKRACWELKEKAFFNIEVKDKQIFVEIKLKENALNMKRMIDLLNETILDQQIRIEVFKETLPIRTIIMAQAFDPCDNLDDVIHNLF